MNLYDKEARNKDFLQITVLLQIEIIRRNLLEVNEEGLCVSIGPHPFAKI
jgi:hypothetical protein